MDEDDGGFDGYRYEINRWNMRVLSVQFVRIACRMYGTSGVARRLKMSAGMVSRYKNGGSLPAYPQAVKIIDTFSKEMDLQSVVGGLVKVCNGGFLDDESAVSDPTVLELAVLDCLSKFAGRRVTKVMTMAVNGVPLATLIASRIGKSLVIVKPYRGVSADGFVEVSVQGEDGVARSYYMCRNAINRFDDVLIVDDIVRSGRSLSVMLEFVRMAHAGVAGIYVLIAVGDRWRSVVPSDVKFECGLTCVGRR